MRAGRFEAALGYFRAVPRDGGESDVRAALSSGEVLRELGRLSEAERAYRRVLALRPDHAAAHERLAFLLGVTGRRWESQSHFLFLAGVGRAGVYELCLLGDLERPIEGREFLDRCSEVAPDDDIVRLGLASQAVADGRADEARRRLREVVATAPHLVSAQAMLGELLLIADDDELVSWNARLPAAAEEYPDTWYVRGLWARRRGELRAAARCFWEAVRRAPAHRRGIYQLGQVLHATGEVSGEDFAERSRRLYELTQRLDGVLKSQGRDEGTFRRVTELLRETGRVREARAWLDVARALFPSATWPADESEGLVKALPADTPVVIESENLAAKHDLSSFPDHRILLTGGARGRDAPASRPSIAFEELADAGVDFVYENGGDPGTPGARMFEQTGGGVAALDYDGDGWIDLFFTQGSEWKTGSSTPTPSVRITDRLFRNVRAAAVDVTGAAGVGDLGFGQGCAAGDFDDDGFTDLYVGNVGRNRLFRNNGDGTFGDATDRGGLSDEAWTSSCVIVDLNADGFPDLFDVNYVTGPDVYERICGDRACSPKNFDGAPDRLHLSRGDGTFESSDAQRHEQGGKGLGIVVADLHLRGRPSLFIANDQVPNFLLRNVPSSAWPLVSFSEEAFAAGLAFNEDGLAMASMGVAADDADGDGRLDFFVTTFKDEWNTLYLQDSEGLFTDATNARGLRSPTLPYVGWGTQFLDADLDGDSDLVAVNGHVDDYRDEGGSYQMRPQFFVNDGERFIELGAGEVGPFFERKSLGRGLTRLDWDRDGRPDVAVSSIGERASLVCNRSPHPGTYLNVRLHATATSRDAIGSVVELEAGGRRWRKQLTAGDGYQASNERVLQFGLGPADDVRAIRVYWPSGKVAVMTNVPVNLTVDLVEGRAGGLPLRRLNMESLAAR